MKDELIIIKQLPVIEEHLQRMKLEIEARVDAALALECNEETRKEVKKMRAELNASLKGFEDRRKEVKRKIEEPYKKFEQIYNENICKPFKSGLEQIDVKIAAVENGIKDERIKILTQYFGELCQSKGIDFLTFEQLPVRVTMSASEKSIKEQIKSFVESVVNDISLIDTQEYKDEIMLEYRRSLNVSSAITTVHNRHIEIAKLAKSDEDKQKIDAAMVEAEKKVCEVMAAVPPVIEDVEKILELSFKVRATREKLRMLKEFLDNGGYDYE